MNPLRFSKILIVDDSPFFRNAMKKILTEAKIGTVYYEAKNGKEAISQYALYRPHLVIMDIVMPVVDGIKATKAITTLDSSAKVIVVSAKENKDTVNAVVNIGGAKDYVLKPFDSGQVVMAVSKQLVVSRIRKKPKLVQNNLAK